MLALFLLIFIVAMCPPGLGTADLIYRWVDDKGGVHFSESPPPQGDGPGELRGTISRGSPDATEPEPFQRDFREGDTFRGRKSAATGADGLLWRIDGVGPKPSFLLGTIHVADSRVLTLPLVVEQAIDTASTFCLELVPDLGLLSGVSEAMLLTDDTDLRSLLGEPWYGKALAAMAERGIPEMAVAHMKPWAVMTILSTPVPAGGPVLDTMLYQMALQQGKRVVGLETADEQIGTFESTPMDDQVAMLKETLRHLDELPLLVNEMIRAYVARDLMEITRLAQQGMSWGSRRIAANLEHGLITERNRRMVDRMIPYLRDGNAFVAVGALHLPGDRGILRLLEDRGYRVVSVD